MQYIDLLYYYLWNYRSVNPKSYYTYNYEKALFIAVHYGYNRSEQLYQNTHKQ